MNIEYEIAKGEIIKSERKMKYARFGGYWIYDIQYYYVVEEKLYFSDLVTLSANEHEWEDYLDKYPKGAELTVHYDKDTPSYAVLEPDTKAIWSVTQIIIMWSGFLFVLSVWGYYDYGYKI